MVVRLPKSPISLLPPKTFQPLHFNEFLGVKPKGTYSIHRHNEQKRDQNNNVSLGQFFNQTIRDCFGRYKAMQGYQVTSQPCTFKSFETKWHGLPLKCKTAPNHSLEGNYDLSVDSLDDTRTFGTRAHYIHGTVLDGAGRRLKENDFKAEKLIKDYGVDALRWWSFKHSRQATVHCKGFDEAACEVQAMRAFLRFCAGNLQDCQWLRVPLTQFLLVDCVAVHLTLRLVLEVTQLMDAFNLTQATQTLIRFCEEMTQFYIPAAKDRLYCGVDFASVNIPNPTGESVNLVAEEKKDLALRSSACTALYTVSSVMVHLLRPFVPYLADELFCKSPFLLQNPSSSSLSEEQEEMSGWPPLLSYDPELTEDTWPILRTLPESVRTLKNKERFRFILSPSSSLKELLPEAWQANEVLGGGAWTQYNNNASSDDGTTLECGNSIEHPDGTKSFITWHQSPLKKCPDCLTYTASPFFHAGKKCPRCTLNDISHNNK